MLRRSLLIIALLATAGCSTHITYHKVNPLKALQGHYEETKISEKGANLFLVLFESPATSTDEIEAKCPSKKGYIKKTKSFGAGLVQILTLGIYSFIDVEVGCMTPKGVSAFKVRLTREQAMKLAMDAKFLKALARVDVNLAVALGWAGSGVSQLAQLR